MLSAAAGLVQALGSRSSRSAQLDAARAMCLLCGYVPAVPCGWLCACCAGIRCAMLCCAGIRCGYALVVLCGLLIGLLIGAMWMCALWLRAV